jgi:acetyltransferase-like isoleucine patch superfamily enzyme
MNVLGLLRRIAYVIRGLLYRLIIIVSGGRCGPGLRVEGDLVFRHGVHSGIRFGKNVYLGKGTVIDCPKTGKVIIGHNVTLTHGVVISSVRHVKIGDDTLIGEYVSIRDAEHGMDLGAGPIRNQMMRPKGCDIGDDVWIGRGCAILAGAQLATGCVIGANSIVKGEIAPDMIAAGSPARPIRSRPGQRKAR